MANGKLPPNISRRDFNKAVDAVEEGKKLRINSLSVKSGYLQCPLCGAEVKYLKESTSISIHKNGMDGKSWCEISTIDVEVRNLSSAKKVSARSTNSKKSEATKKHIKPKSFRSRRPIRDYDDLDELNGIKKRTHWREEYGYIAQDSWGQDFLGEENGKNSVRARSGGRVEGNRKLFNAFFGL